MHNIKMIFRLFGYFRPYVISYCLGISLLIVDLLFSVGYVWMVQNVINTINKGELYHLESLIALYAVISGVGIALIYLRYYFKNYALAMALRDLTCLLLDSVYQAPFGKVQVLHSGDLLSRIVEDASISTDMLGNTIIDFGYTMLIALVSFVYLATLNFPLAILVLCSGPVAIVLGRVVNPKIREVALEIRKMDASIRGHIQEMLQGMKIIRVFGAQTRFKDIYTKWRRKQNTLLLRRTYLSSLFWQVIGLINNLLGLAGCLLVAYAALHGAIHTGQVLPFILLVGRVQAPFARGTQVWTEIQQGLGATTRVMELLEMREDYTISIGPKRRLDERGEPAISLSNVSFGYRSEDKVVRNVSIEFQRGDVIAIVGSSGAGKSTIARICCGLYRPDVGEVHINGMSLTEGNASDFITYVPQTPYVFSGTIRDNIAAGVKVDESRLIDAAKAANAHEFIHKMEYGYETLVTEHGNSLSLGQRQRIALARAFLRNREILILDEPTSALDVQSERYIHESLDELLHGKTAIIIAHRFRTIQRASRILVLDNGEVVEEGNHEELLRRGGIYSRLYHLQNQISS